MVIILEDDARPKYNLFVILHSDEQEIIFVILSYGYPLESSLHDHSNTNNLCFDMYCSSNKKCPQVSLHRAMVLAGVLFWTQSTLHNHILVCSGSVFTIFSL